MRYKKFTGIILKKQNYKEADQIVTVWTKESGKIRVSAKGLRHAKSKLVFSMQELAEVEIEVSGRGNFRNLTSAKCIRLFPGIRSDLVKTALAFYAMELMLKMTADEQSNLYAYEDLVNFLSRLDLSQSLSQAQLRSMLDIFSLKLMRSLGFSMEYAQGSFDIPKSLEAILISVLESEAYEIFNVSEGVLAQLHKTVNRFVEFILERNIKSNLFLASV